MRLDNQELHKLFVEKNVRYLHHANTVATSITYINQGGLLSRGAVENRGLNQTVQTSDDLDKIYNVWNDVFLDTADLHGYFPRQNFYGPVLFKISVDFLLKEDLEIWVTRDNPIYWTAAMSDTHKYFTSVQELRATWDLYQRQKKMVTIRNNSEPILFGYISEILVDNPETIVGNVELFREAVKGLLTALQGNGPLKSKTKIRPTCSSCYCTYNYQNQISTIDLQRLFLP